MIYMTKQHLYLTSNKGPENGASFLAIHTLTTAILDRLLHRSEIMTFDKETDSIRMKYRKVLFELVQLLNLNCGKLFKIICGKLFNST